MGGSGVGVGEGVGVAVGAGLWVGVGEGGCGVGVGETGTAHELARNAATRTMPLSTRLCLRKRFFTVLLLVDAISRESAGR